MPGFGCLVLVSQRELDVHSGQESEDIGLQHGNQIPSNPKAPAIGDDSKLKLKQFAEYMKTAVVLDWDAVNESRPAWNARWNRLIER